MLSFARLCCPIIFADVILGPVFSFLKYLVILGVVLSFSVFIFLVVLFVGFFFLELSSFLGGLSTMILVGLP